MTDEENNAIRLCMAEELDRHKESLNAPFLCVCGRQYEIEDFPDHLVASMHKAITRAFGEVHRPEFSDPSDDNDPYCAGCGNEWPCVTIRMLGLPVAVRKPGTDDGLIIFEAE